MWLHDNTHLYHSQSKRAEKLKENEGEVEDLSPSPPSFLSLSFTPPKKKNKKLYHLSQAISLSDPPIHPFSFPHLPPFTLSSAVSSHCKEILPWETAGPLSVDFWPSFCNDAKQATRTSQCDVMAGCPLNARARTKRACQCCPWCMLLQTAEEVHRWIEMFCFFPCNIKENTTDCFFKRNVS